MILSEGFVQPSRQSSTLLFSLPSSSSPFPSLPTRFSTSHLCTNSLFVYISFLFFILLLLYSTVAFPLPPPSTPLCHCSPFPHQALFSFHHIIILLLLLLLYTVARQSATGAPVGAVSVATTTPGAANVTSSSSKAVFRRPQHRSRIVIKTVRK